MSDNTSQQQVTQDMTSTEDSDFWTPAYPNQYFEPVPDREGKPQFKRRASHVRYRGTEQHGVPFTEEMAEYQYGPHKRDTHLMDGDTEPPMSGEVLQPVVPVQVMALPAPMQISTRVKTNKVTFSATGYAVNTPTQICGRENTRTRLVVWYSGVGKVYVGSNPDTLTVVGVEMIANKDTVFYTTEPMFVLGDTVGAVVNVVEEITIQGGGPIV